MFIENVQQVNNKVRVNPNFDNKLILQKFCEFLIV